MVYDVNKFKIKRVRREVDGEKKKVCRRRTTRMKLIDKDSLVTKVTLLTKFHVIIDNKLSRVPSLLHN